MTTARTISQDKPWEDATIEAHVAGKGIVDGLHYLDRDLAIIEALDYCGETSLTRAHRRGHAEQALKELERTQKEIARLTAALDALAPLLVAVTKGV